MRGLRRLARVVTRSPERRRASHEVTSLHGALYAVSSYGCWVTVAAGGRRCFHLRRSARPAAVPRRFTAGFILPRAEPSSSESIQPAICLLLRASNQRPQPKLPSKALHPLQQAPLGGFRVPSSRHELVVSTCRAKHPASRYVPSSAFLPPSTVFSTTCLAGLFHPTATSRVLPSGN